MRQLLLIKTLRCCTVQQPYLRFQLETRYNLACGPEGHVGQVLYTYGAQDLALWDSGACELNILAWDSARSLETVQEVSWSYVCEFLKLNIFSNEGDSTYFSCLLYYKQCIIFERYVILKLKSCLTPLLSFLLGKEWRHRLYLSLLNLLQIKPIDLMLLKISRKSSTCFSKVI